MTVFDLGTIVATFRALEALASAGECFNCILLRHSSNDWGDLDDDDKRANDDALRDDVLAPRPSQCDLHFQPRRLAPRTSGDNPEVEHSACADALQGAGCETL
jgi:hypothetical protein